MQIDRRKEGEHRGAGVGPSDRCQRSAHRNKARGNQRRKHHRNGGGALAYSAKSEPSQRCTPRAGDEALRTTAHGAAGQAFEARAYAVDAVEEEDERREEERSLRLGGVEDERARLHHRLFRGVRALGQRGDLPDGLAEGALGSLLGNLAALDRRLERGGRGLASHGV